MKVYLSVFPLINPIGLSMIFSHCMLHQVSQIFHQVSQNLKAAFEFWVDVTSVDVKVIYFGEIILLLKILIFLEINLHKNIMFIKCVRVYSVDELCQIQSQSSFRIKVYGPLPKTKPITVCLSGKGPARYDNGQSRAFRTATDGASISLYGFISILSCYFLSNAVNNRIYNHLLHVMLVYPCLNNHHHLSFFPNHKDLCGILTHPCNQYDRELGCCLCTRNNEPRLCWWLIYTSEWLFLQS